MEYKTLGKTGLKVSRMGFGGIPIQKIDEEEAFVDLGTALGFGRRTAQLAYKRAMRNESEDRKKKVRYEEALYKSQGIKVLIVAHSYVLGDAYIGQPFIDYLKCM